MTGVPFERGDLVFEWVGISEDGDFCYIKAHSVLVDMAQSSMTRSGEQSWDPGDVHEYLLGWLRDNLGRPEWKEEANFGWGEHVDNDDVTACYNAAVNYWRSQR